VIDGEAVVCDDSALAHFQRLRGRRYDSVVFLYVFDLLELNGRDLRTEPIENRKTAFAKIFRAVSNGIQFVDHLEFDYAGIVFEHACRFGCEGNVSKRMGSRYRSGRTKDWLKLKNPVAPAVKREAEEDWR
jgi:bifunctional non-homologous end joining protein LigD